MKVHRFPVRVIARVECPSIYVELVGENELELFAVAPPGLFVRRFWRIYVDQTAVAWDVRNLRGSYVCQTLRDRKQSGRQPTYLTRSVDAT